MRGSRFIPVVGVVSVAVAMALSGPTGCGGSGEGCDIDTAGTVGILTAGQVQQVVAQAASFAADRGRAVTIAVADRQGNPLAIFRMTGAGGDAGDAYLRARTAAFFGTNGNAFTTRTAAFILQDQYPPGVPNTTAGPLFGVEFSSLSCSDIQRRGADLVGSSPVGLSGTPGGVPLYDGEFAAGGVGISGGGDALAEEQIALAGEQGFEPPEAIRGDHIVLDGFRLPFTEAPKPDVTAREVGGTYALGPTGTASTGFPRRDLGGIAVEQPFAPVNGSALSAGEVQQILFQAASRGEGTRAAIRKCGPAKINIAVVDLGGRVLGVVRTLDAPIFGFDVSVQKARTALAFSDPGNSLGSEIRGILGVPAGAPLAVSTRAVGFLSQKDYPPAVDGTAPGPLRGRQQQLSRTCAPFGNGITIFPGGLPLYRGGALVGAIGISGDGVDQDEIIASEGTLGFEAPEGIRTDRITFRGTQLPYFKEPRNPGRGT
ncbi:MAG: hypothetical protein QOD06_362 [Candidatus Binatota bacterium]|nr:hypothetical protein [Candidatus Binatota bacterium]